MKLLLVYEYNNRTQHAINIIGIFSTYELAKAAIKTVTTSYNIQDRCRIEVRFLDHIIDDTLLGGKTRSSGLLENRERQLEWGKPYYKKRETPPGPEPKNWRL